jgi:hypothetical protein
MSKFKLPRQPQPTVNNNAHLQLRLVHNPTPISQAPIIRPARFDPYAQQHPPQQPPQPISIRPANNPSWLSQLRQHLPPLALPPPHPPIIQQPSGPPSIPPFQVETTPFPHLAPQAEAAAYPEPHDTNDDPTTPPLDQSLLKRMKLVFKRFPICQHSLPPQHPSAQHPSFAPPLATTSP